MVVVVVGGGGAYRTCHIFETSLVTPTFFCSYYIYEHIINFTPVKFQKILISRTITDESPYI
jgi:hypothetical protein